MRDKTRITISVPFGTTQAEINDIRREYKEKYGDCIVNILISGEESFKENLYNFIKTRINS
jgi:hypothetical protein